MKHKKAFQVLFMLAAALFLLPFGFRLLDGNNTLIGQEAYYHARIAAELTEQRFAWQDELAFGGRAYQFDLYDFVLTGMSYAFGPETGSRLLPLALGLLTVFLLYALLQKTKLQQVQSLSILLLFILSPLVLTTFATSTSMAVLLFLYVCALYALFVESAVSYALAFVLLLGVASYGALHTLMAAVSWYFFIAHGRSSKKIFGAFIAASSILLLSYHVPRYLSQNVILLAQPNHLAQFIADFGGTTGISVFSLLLAGMGFVLMWKHKKTHYSMLAASLVIVCWSFFEPHLMVYTTLLTAFFGGIAFASLACMRWKVKMLKNFCLLVLFCGLLFSTISTAAVLRDQPPLPETREALLWLKDNALPGKTVFTHYTNGFFVEYWAHHPVLTDAAYSQADTAEELFKDSQELFMSNNLVTTSKLLEKHQVGYILITQDMREGLVWEKPGSGLDYLLTNNETFKKLHSTNFTHIWAFAQK